ncbi:MAG: hypothetical protein J7L44_04455 [Candidatus Diapherotrites archaeon]|nr:hypothetical protein [Candidatus Diapherotrites archaeon]
MNKPLKKFYVGNIQIAVWQNTGKNKEFYTVTLSRRFKNANEEWQNSNSLRVNDIPKAILGLQEAYKQLALKELAPDTLGE